MKQYFILLSLVICLTAKGQVLDSLSNQPSDSKNNVNIDSSFDENISILDTTNKRFYNNSIQLIIGGLAGAYSLNYERLLYSNNTNISAELGYSFIPANLGWNFNHSFIFALNGQLGKDKHKLEFGPIMSLYTRGKPTDPEIIIIEPEKTVGLYIGGRIGYRLEFPNKPFLFKAHFILAHTNSIIFPWGSLTFGYRF